MRWCDHTCQQTRQSHSRGGALVCSFSREDARRDAHLGSDAWVPQHPITRVACEAAAALGLDECTVEVKGDYLGPDSETEKWSWKLSQPDRGSEV